MVVVVVDCLGQTPQIKERLHKHRGPGRGEDGQVGGRPEAREDQGGGGGQAIRRGVQEAPGGWMDGSLMMSSPLD